MRVEGALQVSSSLPGPCLGLTSALPPYFREFSGVTPPPEIACFHKYPSTSHRQSAPPLGTLRALDLASALHRPPLLVTPRVFSVLPPPRLGHLPPLLVDTPPPLLRARPLFSVLCKPSTLPFLGTASTCPRRFLPQLIGKPPPLLDTFAQQVTHP